MNTISGVVTRFAPSPTGFLHLGNYRTALFSYLFARQNNGKFFLRIEDTDKERSKTEYTQDIIESLAWLNLSYDNSDNIYYQSQKIEVHKSYLKKMINSGHAYISKETPKEEGMRSEVIRFKNPNKKVTFTDLIRGEVTFDTTELGDFVIAKSLEEPIFHLAVVVDDFEMGITHIVRGEDHISNTPRHILIQEAIGAPRPIYAHLPMVLATDRTKLSKRKGAKSVKEYRSSGYLPEAILNCLAFIGWNPGDDRDILSLEELIKEFKLDKVQKGGAIFNEEKLNWLNREYIKKLSLESQLKLIAPKFPDLNTDTLNRSIPTIIDRINNFNDVDTLKAQGEFDYITNTPSLIIEKLLWKGTQEKEKALKHLLHVIETLKTLNQYPSAEEVKNAIWEYATENGKGDVLWPTRYALTGKDKSPDPFVVISIIGTEEASARLSEATNLLT